MGRGGMNPATSQPNGLDNIYDYKVVQDEDKLPEENFDRYPDDGSSCLSYTDKKPNNIVQDAIDEKRMKRQCGAREVIISFADKQSLDEVSEPSIR